MSRRTRIAAVAVTAVYVGATGVQAQGMLHPILLTPIIDDTPFWDGLSSDVARCDAGFFLLYPTIATVGHGPCNNQHATLDFVRPGAVRSRVGLKRLPDASSGSASAIEASTALSPDQSRDVTDADVERETAPDTPPDSPREMDNAVWKSAEGAMVPALTPARSATNSGPSDVASLALAPTRIAEGEGPMESDAPVRTVREVPEPATWTLTLLGLGAMQFVRWRRRRSA